MTRKRLQNIQPHFQARLLGPSSLTRANASSASLAPSSTAPNGWLGVAASRNGIGSVPLASDRPGVVYRGGAANPSGSSGLNPGSLAYQPPYHSLPISAGLEAALKAGLVAVPKDAYPICCIQCAAGTSQTTTLTNASSGMGGAGGTAHYPKAFYDSPNSVGQVNSARVNGAPSIPGLHNCSSTNFTTSTHPNASTTTGAYFFPCLQRLQIHPSFVLSSCQSAL